MIDIQQLSKRLRGERGSALAEGAILIPVLILLIYYSSAMTDVMVLKIKAQEATRFVLWEMTVFRDPGQINTDLQTRFADLKSPSSVATGNTGLLMYPKAADLGWRANINTAYQFVALNGNVRLPTSGNGFIQNAVNAIVNFLSSTVDGAVQREQFNVFGSAAASVTLTKATHTGSIILNGGDLGGHNSGGNDLRAPGILNNLTFTTPFNTERPMRLVYDSWKAWPKPAQYTTTRQVPAALEDPTVSPMHTYPVVESMVAQQVNKIAFFGLDRFAFFNSVNNAIGQVLGGSISQTLLGGSLPTLFSTAPMDHALNNVTTADVIPSNTNFSRGPITILPPGKPDVSWVPGAGMVTNRLGDQGTNSTASVSIDDYYGMGAGADNSRYTVPYRINTRYWNSDGAAGANTFNSSTAAPNPNITANNNYVKAYACRGHYFAGSTKPQITDPTKRYLLACPF